MATELRAELTAKAIILGIILSIVLAAANIYLGMFAGMTVSASIPAAVISMGIFRLFRQSTVWENNLVQTAAASGEGLAAGAIFTLPALVIMGFWKTFDYWWVTMICALGGVLGVLFTIPLRRSLIVEGDLKFPEGVATAEVIISGKQGGKQILYIIQAAIAGAAFKLCQTGLNLMTEIFSWTGAAGKAVFSIGSNLSPALISVGYIVGMNIALVIFLGGALNWLIAIPSYTATHILPEVAGQAPADMAHWVWKTYTRYIGVGGMILGGVWTIFKMRRNLFSGVASGLRAYKSTGRQANRSETGQEPSSQPEVPITERDIPMNWILILIMASIIPIFFLYQKATGSLTISLTMAVIMVITGFIFSAVSGYMAGLIGSSNNPISGITISTVMLSSLLLLAMGMSADKGPVAAIIIGAVVCCAAAIAGDNMQDLKAGYILKGTPWKQQFMQMLGVISAAFFIAPILNLMLNAYGFKGHESAKASALIAPQANLMKSVAVGVFTKDLPWTFIYIGIGIAAVVIMLDEYLIKRKIPFRTPVLAFSIGIYLPFDLSVPILLGGIIQMLGERFLRRNNCTVAQAEIANRHGLLFASGLITGEALMGIMLAIPIVLSGKQKPLAILETALSWPGVVLLAGTMIWLYFVSIRTGQSAGETTGNHGQSH